MFKSSNNGKTSNKIWGHERNMDVKRPQNNESTTRVKKAANENKASEKQSNSGGEFFCIEDDPFPVSSMFNDGEADVMTWTDYFHRGGTSVSSRRPHPEKSTSFLPGLLNPTSLNARLRTSSNTILPITKYESDMSLSPPLDDISSQKSKDLIQPKRLPKNLQKLQPSATPDDSADIEDWSFRPGNCRPLSRCTARATKDEMHMPQGARIEGMSLGNSSELRPYLRKSKSFESTYIRKEMKEVKEGTYRKDRSVGLLNVTNSTSRSNNDGSTPPMTITINSLSANTDEEEYEGFIDSRMFDQSDKSDRSCRFGDFSDDVTSDVNDGGGWGGHSYLNNITMFSPIKKNTAMRKVMDAHPPLLKIYTPPLPLSGNSSGRGQSVKSPPPPSSAVRLKQLKIT